MQLALGIGYTALIVYIANIAPPGTTYANYVRWMLYGLCLLCATIGFGVLSSANDPVLDSLMCAFCVLSGISAAAFVGHEPSKQFLRRILPTSATYHPDSLVHATALVLIFFQVASALVSSYLAGGVTGVAETLTTQPPNTQQLALDLGINVLFALGGVGFFMRRNLTETAQRLGLRAPTLIDVIVGTLVGIILFFAVELGSQIWQNSVSPATFEQQTSAANALFLAFASTPLLGVALALSSAIGEEILYRGALQPVFGITITTGFFVLMHSQYLFTPAMLLILIIGLALALVRQRVSTTAAIIAHFIYNLIPFALLALQGNA